jgi:hypothetical protein
MESLSRKYIRKSETADRHKKFMLTIIWGVDGFHVVDLMTSQHSFNSEYFMSHVLTPMVVKVFTRGRIPHIRRLQLHLDNCRVHFSKATGQFITVRHSRRAYVLRISKIRPLRGWSVSVQPGGIKNKSIPGSSAAFVITAR